VVVDELDPVHAARLVLTGTGSALVRKQNILRGVNPAV
jgi:hypothetical protein